MIHQRAEELGSRGPLAHEARELLVASGLRGRGPCGSPAPGPRGRARRTAPGGRTRTPGRPPRFAIYSPSLGPSQLTLINTTRYWDSAAPARAPAPPPTPPVVAPEEPIIAENRLNSGGKRLRMCQEPTMINVSAIQMQQFGVQFYQASLTAKDIDKLVRFEVLSYGEQHHPPVRGKKGGGAASKVNWNLLERRIAANEKAYQRQIIRRKIDELVGYYEQCRQARDLPSIPGRRHHLVRREAVVLAGRGRVEPGHPEGARARGRPAGHRRAAPAAGDARRHRALRPGRLHGARRHLRPAPRGPHRPDVRDDQREAHAAELVAPGEPVGPAAVPRSKPRRRPTTSSAR